MLLAAFSDRASSEPPLGGEGGVRGEDLARRTQKTRHGGHPFAPWLRNAAHAVAHPHPDRPPGEDDVEGLGAVFFRRTANSRLNPGLRRGLRLAGELQGQRRGGLWVHLLPCRKETRDVNVTSRDT